MSTHESQIAIHQFGCLKVNLDLFCRNGTTAERPTPNPKVQGSNPHLKVNLDLRRRGYETDRGEGQNKKRIYKGKHDMTT